MKYGETEKRNQKEILRKIAKMSERDILARLIYGEARGEILKGMVAVACNPFNRLRDGRFGRTLKAVMLRPWAYSCFNANDPNLRFMLNPPMRYPFDLCECIAELAIDGLLEDPTDGATHYFNPDIVPGGWPRSWRRDRMEFKAKIGRHEFYRELKA